MSIDMDMECLAAKGTSPIPSSTVDSNDHYNNAISIYTPQITRCLYIECFVALIWLN